MAERKLLAHWVGSMAGTKRILKQKHFLPWKEGSKVVPTEKATRVNKRWGWHRDTLPNFLQESLCIYIYIYTPSGNQHGNGKSPMHGGFKGKTPN